MSSSRVWLITGTSSGFGLEMARYALSKGERVVATLRRPEVLKEFASQYSSTQLLVLKLDVTKPEEIKDAFAKAKETFGRVDVVFNNAGHTVNGEAEAIPDEPARNLLEVDFWGAVHVSQEAIRFFREENSPQGGRLIQNSALIGLVTFPTAAFYAAAKHALEAFTETLGKEVNPTWNIKISSVLAGSFATDIGKSLQMMPQHPAYADESNATTMARKMLNQMLSMGTDKEAAKKLGLGDPAKGVEKIYELSRLPNPPLRLLLGKDANHMVREWLAQVTKEIDEYESWSDDVAFKEE
ncbi:NAD(P)-binding protein [Dichomitus squalens]|uniref:NAD(P)-binding protein n=1 Tax=Dichomitus squalens TaxID=114155 RepID=A0A4Q9MM78_9APHY|nr:NAD(P)-binding protein [Dichomitus squalens]